VNLLTLQQELVALESESAEIIERVDVVIEPAQPPRSLSRHAAAPLAGKADCGGAVDPKRPYEQSADNPKADVEGSANQINKINRVRLD